MPGREPWLPTSESHEEKPPVMKELRRLAFECMPDELKDPADDEERDRDRPEARDEQHDEEQNGSDTTISGIPSVWQRRFTGC